MNPTRGIRFVFSLAAATLGMAYLINPSLTPLSWLAAGVVLCGLSGALAAEAPR